MRQTSTMTFLQTQRTVTRIRCFTKKTNLLLVYTFSRMLTNIFLTHRNNLVNQVHWKPNTHTSRHTLHTKARPTAPWPPPSHVRLSLNKEQMQQTRFWCFVYLLILEPAVLFSSWSSVMLGAKAQRIWRYCNKLSHFLCILIGSVDVDGFNQVSYWHILWMC